MSQHAPRPIPAPPDFPVRWEQPEDGSFFWTWDRMHFSRPMTPLAATAHLRALSRGLESASSTFNLPVVIRYQAINGYGYSAAIPRSFDPAVLAESGRKAEETLRWAVQKLEATWTREFLPELLEDVATYRAFDYAKATDAELGAHVAWALEAIERQWVIHFRTVIPVGLAVSLFADVYQQATQSTDELAPYILLQGLPNKTVDGGIALWRLSRAAAASPAVREALDAADPTAVFATLDGSTEGRAFARDFRAFLDEFGWRGEFYNLDEPTWVDDPRAPLNILRAYAKEPGRASPEAEQAELAAQREAAIAAVRERLAGAPAEKREQFEAMLHLAQFAHALGEDHNYYIDQTLLHLARRAFLRAGQRVAARGQLATADDVMYLTADELRAAASGADRRDFRPAVEERRAEHARAQAMTPPPALGSQAPAPSGEPSPLEKFMLRFFGAPPPESAVATEIRGNAGSKGKATGTALVAMTPEDAASLQAGQILVCPTTAAPWTPLFAVAAAVVTDTGGILSHCAVVAREFGIPAVVGTQVATARIRTGQRITVDGSAGVVTLE